MNKDTRHYTHLLETDHHAALPGELFISLSIAMITFAAICLMVAMLTPVMT